MIHIAHNLNPINLGVFISVLWRVSSPCVVCLESKGGPLRHPPSHQASAYTNTDIVFNAIRQQHTYRGGTGRRRKMLYLLLLLQKKLFLQLSFSRGTILPSLLLSLNSEESRIYSNAHTRTGGEAVITDRKKRHRHHHLGTAASRSPRTRCGWIKSCRPNG